MPETDGRLHSSFVAGLIRDHGSDKHDAPMRSTGYLVRCSSPETPPGIHEWYLEFHCDNCGADVLEWRKDCETEFLQAMRELGLIET